MLLLPNQPNRYDTFAALRSDGRAAASGIMSWIEMSSRAGFQTECGHSREALQSSADS